MEYRVAVLLNLHGCSFKDVIFLWTLNFVHFANVEKIREKYSVRFWLVIKTKFTCMRKSLIEKLSFLNVHKNRYLLLIQYIKKELLILLPNSRKLMLVEVNFFKVQVKQGTGKSTGTGKVEVIK